MESVHLTARSDGQAVTIERVADGSWHAVEDDQVVGRGDISGRPDGRMFVSIDAWHCAVFDRLAGAMLAELPRPLYTLVGEDDLDLASHWERAGFTARRREWECLVPTDPGLTGLGPALPPPGVTIGPAEEGPLRALDRLIRDEVEAAVGWREMPAEVLPRPAAPDLSRYTVAAEAGEYVGYVRLAAVTRQPRIGLVAVRSGHRRRGIGRALLARVLDDLHRRGIETASAEVNESNTAAMALFDAIGARRTGSNLELALEGSERHG
ncbi:GNAT family N-acetyltransferase [Nonomuraea angiospora]|uniref:GNAT family N-acetyltransferase n=1 Tax=Nonomuraea angiospora TaxID=46172 RepID=UPI003798064D